jgi:hypothetical protein
MWRLWIDDEMRMASSVEDRLQILKLHQKAVSDYLDPGLWRNYLKYAIKGLKQKSLNSTADDDDDSDSDDDDEQDEEPWATVQEVRAVCLNASHATSMHFTESHWVWNLIIKFEIHLLDSRYH